MKSTLLLALVLLTTISFSQQLKTTEKRLEIDLKDGRYD